MAKKGYSRKDIIGGGYTHYDEKGKKIGRSEPALFGGYNEYDAKGKKTGSTRPGVFSDYNHYDAKGHKTGYSDRNLAGGYNHYDSKGHKRGYSDPNFTQTGYDHHSSDGGCYIATCVYNSYDCPEVWTLRRFRDQKLAQSKPGRLFIRTYYAISPKLVKLFGEKRWFRSFWKRHLDGMVHDLQERGYSDAPYRD